MLALRCAPPHQFTPRAPHPAPNTTHAAPTPPYVHPLHMLGDRWLASCGAREDADGPRREAQLPSESIRYDLAYSGRNTHYGGAGGLAMRGCFGGNVQPARKSGAIAGSRARRSRANRSCDARATTWLVACERRPVVAHAPKRLRGTKIQALRSHRSWRERAARSPQRLRDAPARSHARFRTSHDFAVPRRSKQRRSRLAARIWRAH